jgi:hypothetical protein
MGDRMGTRHCKVAAVVLVASIRAATGLAQVPANIEEGLKKIGQIVDPACTAQLYRPLMPENDVTSTATPLYPGITVARDVSFGSDPKDVVDVFSADKGANALPVLIYVPGGAGNKIEIQNREANAFYDNIGRWATKNGMVGVTMQRHPGQNWDDGGRDVAKMIQWLQANIAKYRGNPDRMFIWAHSAGNGPLGTYIGRPELHGPKGVGVKGVVFMSGQFNIAPVEAGGFPGAGGRRGAAGPSGFNPLAGSGSSCGSSPAISEDGAVPGRAPGQPGGPTAGRGAGGPGGRGAAPGSAFGGPVDPETLAKRSSLEGLKQTTAKIMLATAELDPGISGKMSAFNQALHDELCKLDGPGAKDGVGHCPAMLFAKDESHMSEVFSIDTDDTIVSGPILAWMKKIK